MKGKGPRMLSWAHFSGFHVSPSTWFLEFWLPWWLSDIWYSAWCFLYFIHLLKRFFWWQAYFAASWPIIVGSGRLSFIFNPISRSCYFSQRADRSRIFWLVCYKYSLETFRLLSVLTFSWLNGLGMKKNTYWDKCFCQLDNALFKLGASQSKFCMVHYPFAALSSSLRFALDDASLQRFLFSGIYKL